jgi:hypothetical protein
LNLKFRRHPHESGDLIVKGLEITLSEGFAVPSQAENDEKRSFLAKTMPDPDVLRHVISRTGLFGWPHILIII